MNPLDDGSNASIFVAFLFVGIIGATLSVIRGMKTIDRIITTAYDEDTELRALACDCAPCTSWYAEKPVPAAKAWWKP